MLQKNRDYRVVVTSSFACLIFLSAFVFLFVCLFVCLFQKVIRPFISLGHCLLYNLTMFMTVKTYSSTDWLPWKLIISLSTTTKS